MSDQPNFQGDQDWLDFFELHAPDYMHNGFVSGTLAEVDFLIENLHLTPGMRILDMGCGTGRHAIELTKRGFHMTGVDQSAAMLAQAKKAADAAQVSVEWIRSPGQIFHADQPFDAVYSVCEGALSLLGANEPFDRDLGVLANLFTALKPGGRGLFTVLNGMRMLRRFNADDIAAGHFDPLNLTEHGVMEFDTPNGKRGIPTHERGYVPTEFRMMLQQVGFVVDQLGAGTAGNWHLTPPELDEMEILAIVTRPLK